MRILKGKITYIIFAIIAVGGFAGWRMYSKSKAPPEYETVKVKRGDLIQTVEATGKIESVSNLSLRFEITGVVDLVKVGENDIVKKGDHLANLRLTELNASVAQADANLRQKMVGVSDADKRYYQAAVDSAKASWDQSKIDT